MTSIVTPTKEIPTTSTSYDDNVVDDVDDDDDDYDNDQERSTLLEIHSPIGKHGDAVVGLQINYANKSSIRRRLVEDASKPPVGGVKQNNYYNKNNTMKYIQERQQRAKSFLELSKRAVEQVDPALSYQALQELAQIDNGYGDDDLFMFSVGSAHAKTALVQLDHSDQPDVCQKAKDELQIRLKRRARNWIILVMLVPPIVALSIYLDLGTSLAPDFIQLVVMAASYVVAIMIGYHTIRQRDLEARQSVQELYMIASSKTKQKQQQQQQQQPIEV